MRRTGSDTGHDPPTTPLALVQVIVDPEPDPATAAVPEQTVPVNVVSENVS